MCGTSEPRMLLRPAALACGAPLACGRGTGRAAAVEGAAGVEPAAFAVLACWRKFELENARVTTVWQHQKGTQQDGRFCWGTSEPRACGCCCRAGSGCRACNCCFSRGSCCCFRANARSASSCHHSIQMVSHRMQIGQRTHNKPRQLQMTTGWPRGNFSPPYREQARYPALGQMPSCVSDQQPMSGPKTVPDAERADLCQVLVQRRRARLLAAGPPGGAPDHGRDRHAQSLQRPYLRLPLLHRGARLRSHMLVGEHTKVVQPNSEHI